MTALFSLLSLVAFGFFLACAHVGQAADPPQLFAAEEKPEPPAAELVAEELTRAINAEITRRVATHRDMFNAFWRNHRATPDEIAAALGTKARLFFQVAAENAGHIARLAALVGKKPEDFLPPEDSARPRELAFHEDGTVTVGGPTKPE